MQYKPLNIPKVIAHRGASAQAPENTLAAFMKAAELGAKWVEFDVTLSKDGEVVVFHDARLQRTSNGCGNIARFTYAELVKLDAGTWFASEYAGERIPRFTDVIKCLADNNLGANIEVKPTLGKESQTAKIVMQILQEHWPAHLPTPLLSSFSLASLRCIRKADPQIPIGLLLYRWREDWQALADELNASSVHLSHKLITQNHVAEIKQTQRLVLAYTVNDVEHAQRLFDLGIDGVFSDCPDRISGLS